MQNTSQHLILEIINYMTTSKNNHMAHAALAVADYILTNGKSFTPMQIMKLVYIAHGWSLGLRQKPLIRERIEA